MLVTTGSVTTASRLVRIIRRTLGINAQVIRTPSELNRGGCSYSVKFDDSHSGSVKKIVSDYGIPVKKWYTDSRGERYAEDDIS